MTEFYKIWGLDRMVVGMLHWCCWPCWCIDEHD